MTAGPAPLPAVAAALRAEGGLLVAALAPDAELAAAPTPLADVVARGPRADGRAADLGLVIEAVHEGWRLHAADPAFPARVLRTDDADLALLAGDRLYALGLARLAELGDLPSIAVLADVIALAARSGAEARPALAHAAFEAGAAGLGWGREGALEQAFRAALDGADGAADAMSAAARQLAGIGT